MSLLARAIFFSFLFLLPILATAGDARAEVVRVETTAGLRAALAKARAGTEIRIAPGTYAGGLFAERLRGTEEEPIAIAGADPDDPPVIAGGTSGLHVAGASWLEIRDLVLRGASGNGLNVDDGGTVDSPSRHVTIRRVRVEDVGPDGNRDGIKLSGVDDFLVADCTVVRWGSGGSAVDMVGCHRGEIRGSTFEHEDGKGSNGVQAKGGTSGVAIRRCRFLETGHRGVNLGGSTGKPYFRPRAPGYEAKDLTVEDCLFVGAVAPVAFVGVDGAVVRHNTILRPGKWVLRILQESRGDDFVPCRNGRFEKNLVVFRAKEVRTIVNVGPGTEPGSFVFAGNYWYCEDEPGRSRPDLPTRERDGVHGRDPKLGEGFPGDDPVVRRGPAAGFGIREE